MRKLETSLLHPQRQPDKDIADDVSRDPSERHADRKTTKRYQRHEGNDARDRVSIIIVFPVRSGRLPITFPCFLAIGSPPAVVVGIIWSFPLDVSRVGKAAARKIDRPLNPAPAEV